MDLAWVVTVASPCNPVAPDDDREWRRHGRARIAVEVGDVDAVHAEAVERGFEIAYSLCNEDLGVRRFTLPRDRSRTVVNVLSHIARERQDRSPAPR